MISNFLELLAESDKPDFSNIVELIRNWGLAFIAFLGIAGGIVAAVFFVIELIKLTKASDPNERHAIGIHMLFIGLGAIGASGGGIVAAVFTAGFFGQS